MSDNDSGFVGDAEYARVVGNLASAVKERDAALARCGELESVLRIVHDHRGLCDSDANETFERTALLFYADTGMLRPGKDMAAASPPHSYEERRKAWHQWCDTLNERIDEKIRQALRAASDPVNETKDQ